MHKKFRVGMRGDDVTRNFWGRLFGIANCGKSFYGRRIVNKCDRSCLFFLNIVPLSTKNFAMAYLKSICVIALFILFAGFNPYHHGWANYDQEKTLDYIGVIQESVYENPHATAKVKHKNKVWMVILAPVSRMEARGVTADMIKKGATIQVVGYPHKEIKNEMRAERIFVDGKKYELR